MLRSVRIGVRYRFKAVIKKIVTRSMECQPLANRKDDNKPYKSITEHGDKDNVQERFLERTNSRITIIKYYTLLLNGWWWRVRVKREEYYVAKAPKGKLKFPLYNTSFKRPLASCPLWGRAYYYKKSQWRRAVVRQCIFRATYDTIIIALLSLRSAKLFQCLLFTNPNTKLDFKQTIISIYTLSNTCIQ